MREEQVALQRVIPVAVEEKVRLDLEHCPPFADFHDRLEQVERREGQRDVWRGLGCSGRRVS